MSSLQPCTTSDCGHDLGPHSITNTGGNTWDGKTEPLEQLLQNEHITIKDRTGRTWTGPLMKVLADSTKQECFDANSPKVVTYPVVMVHDDMKHGFPEKVPELQEHLDDPANTMAGPAKQKAKKDIDDWNKVAMGKLSESRVYDAVVAACKEQGEECLVMASYSSDKFMAVIKEKGKNIRNGDVLKQMNRHEISVVAAMKLDVDPTNDVKGFMGNKSDIQTKDIEKEPHFTNIRYQKVLKQAINRVKKPVLNLTELTHLIQYCKYNQQLQDSSNEVDILCAFPRRKKILQIDTKSSTEDKNILGMSQKAAKQTKHLNELFNKWHGAILNGYTFYRAAAFPNVDIAAKFVAKPPSKSKPPCSKCHQYILTWDKTDEIHKWMQNNIFTGTPSAQIPEYKILVTRIIGFISLAPHNNFYFHTEAEAVNMMAKAITGEDSAIHGSASDAGATAALTDLETNCGYMGLQDKDHALGSLQVFITWNQQQLSNILRLNNMSWARFMVLVSDYGTGKTLLLKNLARAEAERILKGHGKPGRVFYLSLGAAQYTKYNDTWNHDTVFDISTRCEFQNLKVTSGIDVEFKSVADILNEIFPDPKQRTSKLTINQILVQFFLKYRMDHHYGDEVPTQDSLGSNIIFPSLVEGLDDVWSAVQGNIRLAMRKVDDTSIGGGNYNQELQNYRTTLATNYNVQFPSLDTRMRNSGQVAKLSDVVNRGCTPGVTGSLPPYINTVTGVTPKLIITKTRDEVLTTGVEYAINNFIGNQPVVILAQRSDKVDVIYQHLRSSPSPPPVTVYNPGPDGHYSDTQDIVRKYLQAPAGVLLTTIRLFNGMEATSVLVPGGAAADRCAAMRATAHLVYIDYSANVRPGVKELCEVHDMP